MRASARFPLLRIAASGLPGRRFVKAGTLRLSGRAGANRVAFSGTIGRKALRPGTYRLAIVAADAAGNRSASKPATFRVVR